LPSFVGPILQRCFSFSPDAAVVGGKSPGSGFSLSLSSASPLRHFVCGNQWSLRPLPSCPETEFFLVFKRFLTLPIFFFFSFTGHPFVWCVFPNRVHFPLLPGLPCGFVFSQSLLFSPALPSHKFTPLLRRIVSRTRLDLSGRLHERKQRRCVIRPVAGEFEVSFFFLQ